MNGPPIGPTPLQSGGMTPPARHARSLTGDGATGPSAPSEPVRPVTPLHPNLNWEHFAWQPDQAA